MWFVRTAIKHLKLDSMKNLKFRIWDKVENKYIFITKREDYDWLAVAVEYPELYDVQQFTGLLDKQSKEIYEGDIIKNNERETYNIWKVSFFQGVFGILGNDGKHYPLREFTKIGSSQSEIQIFLEVIGNIYENSELLTNPYK